MLGRKDYTQDELDAAARAVAAPVSAYNKLAKAADAAADSQVARALEAMEPLLFNNLALALDRRFVHRLRMVVGKQTNPLNELELISESLMNNDGVLRGNNVIKYDPEQSVAKLNLGERIRLTVAQFDTLSNAVLTDVERRFR
jgi:hypothetical protein